MKGMQEHHQSETIKRNLTMIQHESKAMNNGIIGFLLVGGVVALAALGAIQDSDLAKREWQLEQQQRQLQTSPQYQPSPW